MPSRVTFDPHRCRCVRSHLCESYICGRYELTVIDLFLQPEECVRRAQIVVAPTLIKQAPSPMRLFIGDMTDEKKILLGLNDRFVRPSSPTGKKPS